MRASTRRVVVLLTPGVLAAWPALEGSVPREALSPSVDGPLVGVDDLIGATYFALCDDSDARLLDVTLPRAGETAALPPAVASGWTELRVLKHLSSDGRVGRAGRHARGFVPLNPRWPTPCWPRSAGRLGTRRKLRSRERGSGQTQPREYKPAIAFPKQGDTAEPR